MGSVLDAVVISVVAVGVQRGGGGMVTARTEPPQRHVTLVCLIRSVVTIRYGSNKPIRVMASDSSAALCDESVRASRWGAVGGGAAAARAEERVERVACGERRQHAPE
jgi:hypothetical protein